MKDKKLYCLWFLLVLANAFFAVLNYTRWINTANPLNLLVGTLCFIAMCLVIIEGRP